MGHRAPLRDGDAPLRDGDEQDAFTNWRRVVAWRRGALRAVKRRFNRRVRRRERQETNMTKMYRQGDVLLLPVRAGDEDLEPVPADPRGLVLAEGETSGHHHAVFGAGARLCRFRATPGRVVVVADAGADVRVVGGGSGGVDRHTPISLAPGRYEVRIQRSWTSAGYSRRVED